MSAAHSATAKDCGNDAERQAADLAAFSRMLQISNGSFSLSFAVCDDRKLRDSLIERFSAEVPGIAIIRLPAGVDGIYTTAATQIGSETPAAIFVLDIEASVPFGSDSQPALRTLNGSRELWEHFRCPVVFWLAEYAITLLHRHAPDFWRYRSHQFEFLPEAVSLDDLKAETFAGFEMVDALPYEEKAFRISELERRLHEVGSPPPADLLPHVLDWIYELARLYQHASRYSEAETYLRKALDWAERAYGSDQPQAATALNDLGQLLQATNRLAEAEPLMRRSLEINEASFGPSHPSVAIRLNNLATLLKDTNRLAEAELLMRQALGIAEASYGREHPSVAIYLNNLASMLQDTKRYTEAEPLIRRSLDIDKASYDPEHPIVGLRLSNLALLLQDTNRLAEAELLMRRALDIAEASFGPDHPQVAIRLNNLAHLLYATKRPVEAELLMRRALFILVSSLGLEHPSSQKVGANYVGLLKALKVPEEELEERLQAAMNEAQVK